MRVVGRPVGLVGCRFVDVDDDVDGDGDLTGDVDAADARTEPVSVVPAADGDGDADLDVVTGDRACG